MRLRLETAPRRRTEPDCRRWQRKRSAADGRVGGALSSGMGIRCGQVPELIREPETVQDRLVLLTRARLPVRIDPIAPPFVRQFTQLRDGDRRARSSRTEPATDVLFRPEEIHRASSENDVVPPSNCWDHTMEQQAFIVRPLIAHVDRDRLTAVGARRFDTTIDV